MSYSLHPSTLGGRLAAFAIRAAGWLLQPVRHKGLARVCKLVGRAAAPGQMVHYRLVDGSVFAFELSDWYWSRLLAGSYTYEPEMEHLFDLLAGTPFGLIDCGANLGYWSVYATGPAEACRAALAVEAMPETARLLAENARRNGDRFRVLHRALYDTDEGSVAIAIGAANHPAGAAIAAAAGNAAAVEVPCITIDTLVAELAAPECLIVLKLDVEGVEREAMRAAGRLMARDFLIVYEDLGRDLGSETTAFFLGELGLAVYFLRDDGSVVPIRDVAAAAAEKHQPGRGYNFIATRAGSAGARLLDAALSRTPPPHRPTR